MIAADTRDIVTLFRLFNRVFGRYRARILALFALGFISGFLGGAGVGMLIPFFTLVVKGNTGESDDFFSRHIASFFERFNLEFSIGGLLMFIVAVFFAKAVFIWLAGYLKAHIVADYTYAVQSELYRSTLAASWPYLMRHKLGHLENVIVSDVGVTVQLLKRSLTSILSVTTFLTYLAAAFVISARITLLTLGLGAAIILFSRPFIRRTRAYAKDSEMNKKQLAHQINENIVGIKVIKSLNAERVIGDSIMRLFGELKRLSLRFFSVSIIVSAPVEPLSVVFIAALFFVSYRFQPDFNLASFIVVVYLVQQIFTYVNRLQRSYQSFNTALPHLYRLAEFEEAAVRHREQVGGTANFSFSGALEFKNVSYEHEKGQPTLSHITLSVRKGMTVGIVGASGAGKTTLVDLLLRLFVSQEGEILLDGKNIGVIDLAAWRRHVGYMPQEVFLKNDTVYANIAFYDPAVGRADVERAALFANADSFIKRLPQGYDTVVGERGARLSGGERQRIALARVLARNPSIIVLDEAMSSLDTASEAAIKNALERLHGEVTIIIISHRLSTVAQCDRIFVLDAGTLVEEGDPRTLFKDAHSRLHEMHAAGDVPFPVPSRL